jgi:hypothetical protein
MLHEDTFEELAPFSAYIKTLEFEVFHRLGIFRLRPLPQLDFRALQFLSFDGTHPNYYDLMIYILNAVHNSAISPVSFRLSSLRETSQSILRHPAISKAGKLDIEAGKISISKPYRLTEILGRSFFFYSGRAGFDAPFAISHCNKDTMPFRGCLPPTIAIFRGQRCWCGLLDRY